MRQDIQEILNEIYDIDPTLKWREDELEKVLEKMLEVKPISKIDENFKNDLRQRLYVEAKYWTRKAFNFKNLVQLLTSFTLWWTIAWLSVMFILDSSNLKYNWTPESSRDRGNNIMMMWVNNSDISDEKWWILDKSTLRNNLPKINKLEKSDSKKWENIFEDKEIEEFALKSMPLEDDSINEDSSGSMDSDFFSSDDIDFNEDEFWKKLVEDLVETSDFEHIEQKDISWKPQKFYKYSFSWEFPDLKKEYKYYKITTLNMWTTTVEEFISKPKDENTVKLELDIDRILSSEIPSDSEKYEEIVYDEVVFTYKRIYKMKSEYLVPALWFKWDRHPIKWEWFNVDQIIPLVNIK